MFARPPKLKSIIINSFKYDELLSFYIELGICFTKFIINKNEYIYKYIDEEMEYIIKPVSDINQQSKNLSLSFDVVDLDGYHEILIEISTENVKKVKLEDGYKIIAKDPDGNFLELYERNV